jgi:hypothetical protein
MVSVDLEPSGKVLWRTALVAGKLPAGLIDLGYATALAGTQGRSIAHVLQSIASGWLDRASYSKGAFSVTLGAATHFAPTGQMTRTYMVLAGQFNATARSRSSLVRSTAFCCTVMYGVMLPLRWPKYYPAFHCWGNRRRLCVSHDGRDRHRHPRRQVLAFPRAETLELTSMMRKISPICAEVRLAVR